MYLRGWLMKKYEWTGWSDWTPLYGLAKNKFADVSRAPGTYAIATTSQRIHRVSGTDEQGLLYVGESGWLPSRLKAFYDCIRHGKDTHVSGWRYNLVGIKKCAPAKTLTVRWFATSGKKQAQRAELKPLYAYVLNHCELPPLNYSLGRTLMQELGWRLEANGK
jgi:hypothetical protein